MAEERGVMYMMKEDCLMGNGQTIKQTLSTFASQYDHLYVTIDLDGFSSAYAPGVSAPSPLGLSPDFVWQVLTFLQQTEKVIACDIAEMNPRFDQDNVTARLAARLVDEICKLVGGRNP